MNKINKTKIKLKYLNPKNRWIRKRKLKQGPRKNDELGRDKTR
jgi:hypothetical protein